MGTGDAFVSTMERDEVAEVDPCFLGEKFHEVAFDFFRGLFGCET